MYKNKNVGNKYIWFTFEKPECQLLSFNLVIQVESLNYTTTQILPIVFLVNKHKHKINSEMFILSLTGWQNA